MRVSLPIEPQGRASVPGHAPEHHEVLPGAYGRPLGAVQEVRPEVLSLARTQVHALLETSPTYKAIEPATRKALAHNLVKIAAYTAAQVQDSWQQSRRIGQTPLVRQRTVVHARPALTRTASASPRAARGRTPLASAQAEGEGVSPYEFDARAANNMARITEDTLNAIAFPTFVADLVRGTFQAIVDASIQQMEAFGELLANVAKTVDEFMADNITDNQARDWLSSSYPQVVRLDTSGGSARAVVNPEGTGEVPNSLRRDLQLGDELSSVDDDGIEEVLVPAARRRLAQSRQQVLATMVLMGINRIVVTSGKIRAQMGFRIDTTDRARAEKATEFDYRNETTARYSSWLSPVTLESRTSVAYVSTTKRDSESEINAQADLTGEVDLKFKSETFPLERFADAGVLTSIQSNTAVPAANKPITGSSSATDSG